MDSSIQEVELDSAAKRRKFVQSVLLVLCISVSWVCSTQVLQSVQKSSKHKEAIPAMFAYWFSWNFKVFCIIPVWIARWYYRKYKPISEQSFTECLAESKRQKAAKKKISEAKTQASNVEYTYFSAFVDDSQFAAEPTAETDPITQNVPTKRLLKYVPLFCSLAFIANYAFIKALRTLSASEVSALFNSEPAWVFLLSALLLKTDAHSDASTETESSSSWESWFTGTRMCCVLLSITGVLMIELRADGWSMSASLAIWLPLISSMTAATFLVLFRRLFADLNVWNVARFTSLLGTANLLFVWPIVLLFSATFSSEHIPWRHLCNLPFAAMCASGISGLVFDVLINYGAVFAYPLFVSLGLVVGIPLNVVVDYVLHNQRLNLAQGFGVLLICFGFVGFVVLDHLKLTKETTSDKCEVDEFPVIAVGSRGVSVNTSSDDMTATLMTDSMHSRTAGISLVTDYEAVL